MNIKKILIIAAVFLGLIIAGIYIFLTKNNNLRIGGDQDIQKNSPSVVENYYDRLANDCKSREDEGCCRASLGAMRYGGYLLMPPEGCPAGYKSDRMRCMDSYRWCEPENL